MTSLTLYTRPECHLCHEAESILAQIQPVPQVIIVNIEESEALEKKYGLRIPVIANSTLDKEINWPFGPQDILELMQL